MRRLDKDQIDIINYIVVCISEFSERYNIDMKDAYDYLSRFKSIDFLIQFYDVEHTLSFDDVIDDLISICKRNGETFSEIIPWVLLGN